MTKWVPGACCWGQVARALGCHLVRHHGARWGARGREGNTAVEARTLVRARARLGAKAGQTALAPAKEPGGGLFAVARKGSARLPENGTQEGTATVAVARKGSAAVAHQPFGSREGAELGATAGSATSTSPSTV